MYFSINKTPIGNSFPTYFIAEIGSNFDGDLSKAKELIYLAKEAGANAAKFQHYTAESLVSSKGFNDLGDKLSHQASWEGSVFEVYNKAALNSEWTAELKAECDSVGIDFMTSPYSEEFIDLVAPFLSAFKVGSGDITCHHIIAKMASHGKPLLIATGASSIEEVRAAYESAGGKTQPIALLQCNTNYTAHESNYRYLNLNVLKTFKTAFPDAVLGLSDHMPGYIEVLGAVALGARIIEKHFTDSNDNDGPDHKFALEPDVFSHMVRDVRRLESALGDGIKKIEENELETVVVQQRSLCASEDLGKGALLSEDNLVALRPFGVKCIPPYKIENLIGKELKQSVVKGEAITLDMLGLDKI